MDDEWEEEVRNTISVTLLTEQLVVVELSGIINNDFLSKCRGTCKILDIDSEKPMMQVGQYVFAGEYEDALGTCVLFKEGPQKGKSDSGPELKYMCHTVKKLMMQRIFLTEKKEGETSTGGEDSGEQSSQEGNANQQGETEEDMDNTDLEDGGTAIL
ncbi:general transcription factor 3C polypeptide 6 isoform X3 [Micropterus dolomieu]|uniref:general transcription factor 3C polypeptide 6 isoform X3 n=1 Tax=Micropterus dolomieu TaxID=147949 RepID=UPI001E8DF443|nr:general transcription factor 3C polypeptide 6 isoform X3 [Micropterus dolomieu]